MGDAAATEILSRGELNLGHLCRVEFGKQSYSVGFGTNTGTVAAASSWDAPVESKPSCRLFQRATKSLHRSGVPSFFLDLNQSVLRGRARCRKARLERAIGVIYRPETELASHYFQAVLPNQFDEFVWFDKTTAITPLKSKELEGLETLRLGFRDLTGSRLQEGSEIKLIVTSTVNPFIKGAAEAEQVHPIHKFEPGTNVMILVAAASTLPGSSGSLGVRPSRFICRAGPLD